MRKVLFLMFLLLLMGLGAAGVKAQVRIGGNTPPSAAAVLDLNATDATNTGTRGLVLPRVDLTSNTMQLTAGVANVTGTMVYNTTATLGAIGMYYWNGNNWVQASLPSISPADSGNILKTNGTTWLASLPYYSEPMTITASALATPLATSWSLVVDAAWTTHVKLLTGDVAHITSPSTTAYDICFPVGAWGIYYSCMTGVINACVLTHVEPESTVRFRCYRPSA